VICERRPRTPRTLRVAGGGTSGHALYEILDNLDQRHSITCEPRLEDQLREAGFRRSPDEAHHHSATAHPRD
jgi:hypothetical protein